MLAYNQQKRLKSQLKNKLIALFLCVCILLTIIFMVASFVYTKIAEQKVIIHTENNLSQASNYISLLIDQAKETAQYISQKTEVAQFANLRNPSVFEKYVALESIRQDIILLAELDTNIDSIYVYFENAGIVSTSIYGNYLVEVLEDTAIYNVIQSSDAYVGSLRYIDDDFISKRESYHL